jgi:peptide/nickel transport system substrate-binding protein
METPQGHLRVMPGVRRRDLLKAGLAAGVTLSARPLHKPTSALGAEAGQPKRGGILRVRGYDSVHFDHHLTTNFKTNATLSFVHSRLVRHKVGAGVQPGTFLVEPDLAERWEQLDDTTYVFHLRQGVRWHNKPPVNGREVVAEDVKFTFDRFLTEKGNRDRELLEPVDRVEVVDRSTVKFVLKEPYVWLINTLAYPRSMWSVAPEVVQHFGDLKKPESAIGTDPFLLERYEPNVETVFTRNPQYFRDGQSYVDRVEWMVIEDASTGLAMYRTGQLDCSHWHQWSVRQADLEAVQKSHPHLMYQDVLNNLAWNLFIRADQAPFNDVRVRRAVSLAIDRQGLIDAVTVRGAPSPAIAPGLAEWSLPIDQLGEGAQYYQHNPQEARRLLAEAGFPKGLKTLLYTTGGFGPDFLDAGQLIQRYLKDVGIEAELKIQEYGAYYATTVQGKFEGMGMGSSTAALEPDIVLESYMADSPRNIGYVNGPALTALVKEQRRTKDLQARKRIIDDIQRLVAAQQHRVNLLSPMVTGSWQPYVKNYAPNLTNDYGGRAAALWLDR